MSAPLDPSINACGIAPPVPPAQPSWLRRWRRQFGLPPSYLAIDVVTTGLDPESDLIVELGACEVIDGRVHDRYQVLVDWSAEKTINQNWLRWRLAETAHRIEQAGGQPTGRKYPIDYPLLIRDGLPPRKALNTFVTLIQTAGWAVLGHNAWQFDVPFLRAQAREWLGLALEFDSETFIDTAMIEKASQTGTLPRFADTPGSFWERVSQQRDRGARWSLYDHCVPKYGLDQQHALALSQAYRAGCDAYVAHLLFEEYRRLAA